jgi:hypothetical protein
MEKTAPPKLPEQLALPFEEPVPPTEERDVVRPRQVWTTLGPRSRASAKERWVAVMREVAPDARN